MKYIVVDLEMNPISEEYREFRPVCSREVIEIGAVMLDEEFRETGSFKTYVKPQYNRNIGKRIQELTGITDGTVADAPQFADALDSFFAWCSEAGEEVRIYQWSVNDCLQIRKEAELKELAFTGRVKELMDEWSDFQKEFEDKLGLERDVSLTDALFYAGMDFDGAQHDALNDARNTAILLETVKNPEKCRKALDRVISALETKSIGTSLGDLFDFGQFHLS